MFNKVNHNLFQTEFVIILNIWWTFSLLQFLLFIICATKMWFIYICSVCTVQCVLCGPFSVKCSGWSVYCEVCSVQLFSQHCQCVVFSTNCHCVLVPHPPSHPMPPQPHDHFSIAPIHQSIHQPTSLVIPFFDGEQHIQDTNTTKTQCSFRIVKSSMTIPVSQKNSSTIHHFVAITLGCHISTHMAYDLE